MFLSLKHPNIGFSYHHLLIVVLLWLSAAVFSETHGDTIQLVVVDGADDAEQLALTGTMSSNSSQLGLGQQGILLQFVGLRFQNIPIPRNSNINSAEIRFTSAGTSVLGASFVIEIEAANNASGFNTTAFDLSSRTTSTTTVDWNSVSPWLGANDSGAAQTSPELSSLVQATVDRSGWIPGNALAFIFTGSGTRIARSFEAGEPAVLEIDFDLPANPDIVFHKHVEIFSDPINGTVDPKAIPGALIQYRIIAENYGGGSADSNSVIIVEPVPTGTRLFVNDISGAGSGPLLFLDGPVSSGLNYNFAAFANPLDDIEFSNNGGSSFDYVPLPDALGYDDKVTHVRVNPKGPLNAASGGNAPGFEMQYRVQVN